MDKNQKNKGKQKRNNDGTFLRSDETLTNEYDRVEEFLNSKNVEDDFNSIDDILDEEYQAF